MGARPAGPMEVGTRLSFQLSDRGAASFMSHLPVCHVNGIGIRSNIDYTAKRVPLQQHYSNINWMLET